MSPINSSERTREPVQHDQSDKTERTTASEHDTPNQTCPECDGKLETDSKHGETSCQSCGLVVDDDKIDHGAEWRAYSNEEQKEKSRVGDRVTPTIHDKGLSTQIDWRDKDSYGNTLSSRQREKMNRLRTWNKRFQVKDSQEQNLRHGLGEIARMISALGLPKTARETASVILRRVIDEGLLPGRSIEGAASAAVYTATRQANIARSLDEITAVSRIEKLRIARAYRYINRELELETPPPEPMDYLPRLASELELSEKAEQQAHDLLKIGIRNEIHSGRNPVGIAAAAIYAGSLLANEKVKQETVGDIADVSNVTIRNRYQELLELYDDTLNQS